MPSSNVCWGIEIGAGAIKAVKLEADNGRVNLLDFAIIEHPKVLSTPGIDVNDVLRVSLGQLVSQYDLSNTQISVSIPGHSSFARFAKLPPVEPKKIPDIVKFEAMQQIPFGLEQVEWDYQTFQSPDSPEIEVGIFAVTKEKIDERLRMLADVGITPNHVTLSPLAVFNALAFDLEFTEKTEGTILVDIGTQATDLIICEAGRVWVRTFPIGGHNFTEALVEAFKISYPAAEKHKREAEASKHARQIFQAMRPIFTDIGQDISRSIGYYSNLHRDAKLERLIGMGATFELPGIRKFLQQQLGLTVYRVEEFKKLNVDSLKNEERAKQFKERAVAMCTAYGLALQGVGMGTIGANLMPVKIIRETMWKGKVKWFGLAAGLAVAASAAMFIRPTLDYLTASSNQKPGEISNVLNDMGKAKSDASEKGVDKSANPDYRAANMLALLQNRDIYAQLSSDLGEIFKDAEAKAKAWKKSDGTVWPAPDKDGKSEFDPRTAFTLKVFDTQYTGAAAAAVDPNNPGAPPPAPTPDASGATPTGSINIQMMVTTHRADAADAAAFMIKTVDEWLKKNAKRPGVQYVIRPPRGQNYWSRQGEGVHAEDPSGDAPSPEVVPQPTGDGGGGGGKGSGRGGAKSGGGDGGRRGGGGDGPSQPENISGDQALALAPVSKLVPQSKAPGSMFTMTVTWTIDIMPPAAETKPKEPGT